MSNPPPASGSAAPSPAGIYDYLLGGHHHSAADREAAEKALAIAPEARFAARENRAFLQRVVRYIADHGVRQYIDIGSGFPTVGPVHEIAAGIVADPHVVYVDYDPAVATLSRELLKSPNVVTIARDLRRPWDIIDDPEVTQLIDWSQPVAVLMVAILHFLPTRRTRPRSSRPSATTWRREATSCCRTALMGKPRRGRGSLPRLG
jgi:S-adenosyl methyltransferase